MFSFLFTFGPKPNSSLSENRDNARKLVSANYIYVGVRTLYESCDVELEQTDCGQWKSHICKLLRWPNSYDEQ